MHTSRCFIKPVLLGVTAAGFPTGRRDARPFGPVFFANTDSVASVSSFAGAVTAARAAAEAARRHLVA